jgi:hypothetical protein
MSLVAVGTDCRQGATRERPQPFDCSRTGS